MLSNFSSILQKWNIPWSWTIIPHQVNWQNLELTARQFWHGGKVMISLILLINFKFRYFWFSMKSV